MQVLQCLNTTSFAGTERHVADLCNAIRAQGVDVQVASVSGSALADKSLEQTVSVVPIERGWRGSLRNVLTFRRHLKRHPDAVLHCHNGITVLQATIAKTLAGCGSVVFTQHFLSPARTQRRGLHKWIADRAHRWVHAQIDHTIAVSDAVRDALLERGDATADRVTRVHHGSIAAAQPHRPGPPRSIDRLRIFCAARLEAEKRLDVLIDAISRAVQSDPEIECKIAGEGRERSRLQLQIHSQGLSQRVKLLGFCADVSARMDRSDVLVLPSDAEPFGLVLLEAMRSGCAVIAADAGGPREIVVNGNTGWLVPPNDPHALSMRILEAARDPERTCSMGAAGRTRFLQFFTADRMARETIAVYQHVLQRRSDRSATETAPAAIPSASR